MKQKEFVTEILRNYQTSMAGLTSTEVNSRRIEFGYNEIASSKKRSRVLAFLNNFTSPLVIILLIVSVITLILGKYIDSGVIFLVTVINAIIGYIQEEKAADALNALRKMTAPIANVIRAGERKRVNSRDLVPGDIVILEEGDKVPADGVLIEANELLLNESVLTGESLSVTKHCELGDESSTSKNVYMGTMVDRGNGLMVVTQTGIATEFGEISKLVDNEIDSSTPLQKKLAKFSAKLGVAIIIICIVVFLLGLASGQPLLLMFELSISLAVSAIPEGLPVAITVILVMGMKRMAKRKAIIRNLTAVETLGTTTVIACDKTGTLTHNKLTVTEVYSDSTYVVTDEGYGLKGKYLTSGIEIDPRQHLRLLMTAGAVANNGDFKLKNEKVEIFGDPTDVAILIAAHKAGINKSDVLESIIRLDEIPFSSERKYMAVLVDEGGTHASYLKGAYEEVMRGCEYIYRDGKTPKKINIAEASQISRVANEMMSKGLRVIALAYRQESVRKEKLNREDLGSDFSFVGLIGMRDTYRVGVKEAISKCKSAGIRIMMLTGDHLDTAMVIGRELGIMKSESEAILATKIEQMSEAEVREAVKNIKVFARISPLAKYKIIEALKKNGEIVAMTGDGVNDVPALKKADIGVAMGIMGTEAAKEAGDMVLTDDNFSTIVAAIAEGRTIFENIRKTIFYLLSTNLGEVLTLLVGLLMGLPLILEPLQILWMNMVTDTAATIPLGLEPAERDHLNSPPRDPKEPIITRKLGVRVVLIAAVMAATAVGLFLAYYKHDLVYARTMAFAYLIFAQWANAFNSRSETRSVFAMNFFSNKALIWGVGVSIMLQLTIMYTGVFERIFGITTLNFYDWLIVGAASLLLVLTSEGIKLVAYLVRSK